MSHQLLNVRTAVEQHSRYRQEKFEENQRFQERTDIAERIGYPIRTLIRYELISDGLYAQTDTKHVRFSERTREAMILAPYQFIGDQAFEVTRRQHEHDEAVQAEAFARGELDGNVLIKISKVPDAIVAGETSIKGYKRDTLRTFVRVYTKDVAGDLECRLFSLDHNDQDGLHAIEGVLGIDLTNRSSEDILADHVLISTPEVPSQFSERLIDELINAYDSAIYRRNGDVRHAGSLFDNSIDAQRAVDEQDYLMAKHYTEISAIVGLALEPSTKNDLLNRARQRTAASVALVLRGAHAESISEADISSEVSTGNYEGDCALSTENAMQQGETGEREMTCPHCGFKTVGDPCAMVLKCNECKALVINGVLVSRGIGRAAVMARQKRRSDQQMQSTVEPTNKAEVYRRPDKSTLVKRVYGEKAMLRIINVVGGANYVVQDTRGVLIDSDSHRIRKLLR